MKSADAWRGSSKAYRIKKAPRISPGAPLASTAASSTSIAQTHKSQRSRLASRRRRQPLPSPEVIPGPERLCRSVRARCLAEPETQRGIGSWPATSLITGAEARTA